jgi:hypothetical protein
MKCIGYVIALLMAVPTITEAAEAEIRYTHGVFYPGLTNQPVLQVKISGEPGEKVKELKFTTGKSGRISDIKIARVLTSRDWNGFTYNTNKLAEELAKKKPGKGGISFKVDLELGSSPTYMWLSYDLSEGMKRNTAIDGECTEIIMADGSVVKPTIVLAKGLEKRKVGRVYPFPYRVVPYYRPRWVKGWGNAEKAVHLTPAHFNLFTDLIHFAYSVTADGNISYQWAGGGISDQEVADGALKEIKRLHKEAKSKAKLIAGFAHMDEPMTTAVANPDTRRTLARNMAAWAIERGYDGIDIDWEYPDTWEQWQHLGYFIADLREELSGTAMSISIASSVTYKVPNYWTTDQLDFLMTMSYDDLADQHSSMQRFQGDANKCLNDFHMPKQRIVVGLPFYSNQQGTLTTQYGYSQIIAWYPRMKPSENVFRSKNQDGSDGPMHSFNGPDLITEKCRWLKQAKFGGVMIWAYDTDLPLKHKASLAKAMYKVIRQPKKKSEEKDSAK